MIGRGPTDGWRWWSRIGALGVVGAAGFANRAAIISRPQLLLVAVLLPIVWIVTGFEPLKAGESEANRRRRMRNIAIGLALFAMVALFYAATMVRMGSNALNRPL
jgi:NO-binding membrane sensor protein with MHYT domain